MYSGILQKAKDKLTSNQQEYLAGISATAQSLFGGGALVAKKADFGFSQSSFLGA
jgi:hypothetical protein